VPEITIAARRTIHLPGFGFGAFLCASLALFVSCGADRSASGTTGTEAGNALAMVVQLPDGAPAARASVVARPSTSLDSTQASMWVRAIADAQGRLDLRLPAGEWTLEIRSGRFARISTIRLDRDSLRRDTLVGIRALRGIMLGSAVGRVGVPGLGRSVSVRSDGSFLLDSMPDQPLPLSIGTSGLRIIPAGTGSVVLAASGNNAVYGDPVRLSLRGSGLAGAQRVADSLVPDSGAVLLDSLGRILPMRRGGASNGVRRLWTRLGSGRHRVLLCRALTDNPDSLPLFGAKDGDRLAIVPDLAPSLLDLSGAGGTFASGANPSVDSLWGPGLDAPLGSFIGTIGSGLLDTGAFALVLQARLLSQGIESLWLLDWTDSSSRGLRVGMGGRRLRVVAPGIDTAVAWDPGTSWSGIAFGWDGSQLVVATDGTERLRLSVRDGLRDRSSWDRRIVGQGGGMRLSRLTIRSGAIDWKSASSLPGD